MQEKITICLLAVSILAGLIGYFLAGNTFYESLIGSLGFLTMSAPFSPTNLLIEIARWCGVLFALNVIYSIIEMSVSRTKEAFSLKRAVRDPRTVAVHGDDEFADTIAENLGGLVIRSCNPIALQAKTQIIMFSRDSDVISFYRTNLKHFTNKQEVYLSLDSIGEFLPARKNVFPFSMSDVCAELYWADNPVTSRERIIIIGDGVFAESILAHALLVNIFSVEGGVDYRVYGDYRQFLALHPNFIDAVNINGDTVQFYDKSWFDDIECVRCAQRIIIVGNDADEDLEITLRLRSLGIDIPIHLRSNGDEHLDLLQDRGVVQAFGTARQLCTKAIVLQQIQHDAGKICDIAYRLGTEGCNGCTRQNNFPLADIIEGASDDEKISIKVDRLSTVNFSLCLRCERFLHDWDVLDTFTKRSNYAVAAHDSQKIRLLGDLSLQYGVPAEDLFTRLSLQDRDRLQEIEHIRWMRFHYLNNWTFGAGKKDKIRKTHPYLVPYADLERCVKDLDGDAYFTVFYRTRFFYTTDGK